MSHSAPALPATPGPSGAADPAAPARAVDPALRAGNCRPLAGYQAQHVLWHCAGGIATVTLNRPERKNPLTFDAYAELRDLFVQLRLADDVQVVVLQGAGGNFCSGGDVHEIIGPLIGLPVPELLRFTRMTGDLVKAMRACPQPIVAAVDGVCAGAGAILAMAADLRLGTARSRTAFLFNRVGLAGCDMGACAILPRLIGQGRASELLYTGRSLGGEEGERWGFFNRLVAPEALAEAAQALAAELAAGPTFAHGITKTMLHQEWSMPVDQALEAEAQAQAICMLTGDFERAYRAFVARQRPQFLGR
ncbi:MAG: enoyl-CoA hydratase family protein [Burkholderiaceae bacterium]|nr:enoyl-CoA hydratase family protein [Burkholderiaceae bacterium]